MTNTEQLSDLLRDLVESFTDHHASLAIEAKPVPGGCYWSMRAHADDQPKLIGKQGAHVQALRYLVSALGDAAGETHRFTLDEPEAARRQFETPPRLARTYDPRDARDLLCRILDALGLGQFAVEVRPVAPTAPLSFEFLISTRSDDDYRALTVSPPGYRDGATAIASLGTLFRAYAKKDGVRFSLVVNRP